MKTTRLFSFLILISLVSNANAQLRVLSNGRVQAGLLKDNNEDLGNVTSMQIYGRIGDARAGSKLTFGDFGQYANQGWNVFAGEYGTTDTDQLWLHGKLGIYMTTNGYANNVVAYYNPASNTNFVFNTNLRVNGVNITSDARLKENVESLQNPLALLEQVNGVSYSYNLSTLEENREQDESKFSATLDNGISGSSSDSEEIMDAATIAKINRDKQIQAEIDRREAAEASRKRIGFLAQDIQKVLPELVQTDENGMMSIDYIGFIPLIVESIKEMQQTIQQQNEVIDNLQALLSPEVQSQLRSNTTSTSNISAVDGAKLYNREGASVSYTLPATFVSASLQIFDVTGKPVKVIKLDNGSSNVVEVSRSELGYGTFIYTLFVAGKKAVFFKDDQLFVTDIPKGKADLSKPVNLANMKITVDYTKEWAQIFDEAWRAFRDGFYLENMHGKDWKAIKEKYAALLPYVKTRLDLNYIIGEMIGELGVGHAYVNPGEVESPKRVSMGLLGAEVSRDKSGFFRLEKILPGASWSKELRSPLTEPGVEAKAGEYIVAIDGVPTNSVNDMYKLLIGKANVPTELSLNSKPQLAGARKIVVSPLAEEYSLYHYNWIQDNIKKVDKATNGKVGYIYIPDMGPEGLNEFSRYFYPQLDKEGLIIDDRANGGGNVSPMILERLSREPYRLTMRRGSSLIGTVPDAVQVGPKVCLINKYSASDGDLFPWGFRALGLGKLIGTRTWGGIIGISGPLPYMDGTDIRVPFFTSYDPKTGNWIIENHGVDPDILIDNDPIKEWNGEDQQLDRAIEEVMKQLKERKPLAPVPAPRDWSHK